MASFFVIKVSEADRDRVNALAAHLTTIGYGKVGQADAVKFLLDWRERTLAEMDEES